MSSEALPDGELAARCHEVQVCVSTWNVPDFENLLGTGMAVRLALHIRGLPQISWEVLHPWASHFLQIPGIALRSIVQLLAEVEFLRLITTGNTINAIIPDVPYYEDVYASLGAFAKDRGFNEAEELSIEILRRLARAPENADALHNKIGAEKRLFDRAVTIGDQTGYLTKSRRRGRDILLSPTYFGENSEIFADAAAAGQSNRISVLMDAIRQNQGLPLSLITKQMEIGGIAVSKDDLQLLTKLAQDGAVKPPSIETGYSGVNHFMFSPTPGAAALAPTKREIYERAMAIVAAVRQGQYLSQKYPIHNPRALIYVLRRDMKLRRGPQEANQQYRNIVRMRIAQLIDLGNGYSQLQVIDLPENREAIDIAFHLIHGASGDDMEVDENARFALQQDTTYIESLVASSTLKRNSAVALSDEQQSLYEQLLLKY